MSILTLFCQEVPTWVWPSVQTTRYHCIESKCFLWPWILCHLECLDSTLALRTRSQSYALWVTKSLIRHLVMNPALLICKHPLCRSQAHHGMSILLPPDCPAWHSARWVGYRLLRLFSRDIPVHILSPSFQPLSLVTTTKVAEVYTRIG